MKPLRQARAIARLDLAEVMRSRWLAASTLTYALLAALFIAVGLREAPLLGFPGAARAMFAQSHALLLLWPRVALRQCRSVVLLRQFIALRVEGQR